MALPGVTPLLSGKQKAPPVCRWCVGPTRNMTRICDKCWANREALYLARKQKEATAELSLAQRESLSRARRAKRLADLPVA
jgi:hypothetical protein